MGQFVCQGKELSPGLAELLWKTVQQKSLNSFTEKELKYLHMVLTNMLNYTLNIYLLRETLAHTGTRDEGVLARKVPDEFWKLVYDGCVDMGVTTGMLLAERQRAALWLHFNSNPDLLTGLTQYVWQRLGISCPLTINPRTLMDGNYLFNLGGVIPSRLLMVISYCLLFWGRQEQEPWVRLFSGKIFVLYLIITGHILPQKSILSLAANTGYRSLIELVVEDLLTTRGLRPQKNNRHRDMSLEYLFIFNNSVLL